MHLAAILPPDRPRATQCLPAVTPGDIAPPREAFFTQSIFEACAADWRNNENQDATSDSSPIALGVWGGMHQRRLKQSFQCCTETPFFGGAMGRRHRAELWLAFDWLDSGGGRGLCFSG